MQTPINEHKNTRVALTASRVRKNYTKADGRTRTDDLLITNQLLYQLSYASTTT